MTTSVRILTTSTWDSSPSILLISPNGNKTLVNCGEGCQRSFLEGNGLRVRSVNRVCLTHIAHNSVGGLPGMILTTADVAEATVINQHAAAIPVAKKNKNNINTARPQSKRKGSPVRYDAREKEDMPGLDVVGPRGTQQFLHSLRHFMRRDRFQLKVYEGEYRQIEQQLSTQRGGKRKKRGRKNTDECCGDTDGFHVETIPLVHRSEAALEKPVVDSGSNASASPFHDDDSTTVQLVSFVFTTQPILGKFLPDIARELGIPPGPLYGQLKSGRSVTFVHPSTKKETTVQSHEVVTKGSPGVSVAVIYCPSLHVLKQLKQTPTLIKLGSGDENNPVLEVMVHMVAPAVLHSVEYRSWMKSFSKFTKHITMESPTCLVDRKHWFEYDVGGSPFQSAALGAMTRSLLHDTLYPSPAPFPQANGSNTGVDSFCPDFSITPARPMMEYILIPRSKKGFTTPSAQALSRVGQGVFQQKREEVIKAAHDSGGVDLAKSIVGSQREGNLYKGDMGELVFTGTGSAIPCKHRNVTGMYLRMPNGNGMLLDVGEGTIGQLLQVKRSHRGACDDNENFALELLRSIKAVWISHPHADHHLGLLRFLTERNAICGRGLDPVVLMAPPNMFRFLSEYSSVDPRVKDSFKPLDCCDMVMPKRNPMGHKLWNDLGITNCVAVPVAHCPHSYAIVIDGTGFGRVAYSGDCRPSTSFAEVGVNTDLLVHEATFEDGMEDEAMLKRHSTVGEALEVGRRMNAKAIVLTHFSQRYPRIPPIKAKETMDSNGKTGGTVVTTSTENNRNINLPVVFAFDFMTLTPGNVVVASKLTPALRLMYPDGDDAAEKEHCVADGEYEGDELLEITAAEVLSVPGIFAQKGIL